MDKIDKKIKEKEELFERYKKISGIVRIYKERPDNWTIKLNHWHSCMIGTGCDFETEDYENEEIVKLFMSKVKEEYLRLKTEIEKL